MKNEADTTTPETPENKKSKNFVKIFRTKSAGFFSDFKKFISKGNVMNLAIGLVMGAAFTAIVNSLVADIIMPVISIIFGKNNLADMVWRISEDITVNYGKFIYAILNFLIVALFLFLLIRTLLKAESGISHLKKMQKKAAKRGLPPPEAPPAATVKLESAEDILKDIRALLTALNASNSMPEDKQHETGSDTPENPPCDTKE